MCVIVMQMQSCVVAAGAQTGTTAAAVERVSGPGQPTLSRNTKLLAFAASYVAAHSICC